MYRQRTSEPERLRPVRWGKLSLSKFSVIQEDIDRKW
jgi:hypothetical protein